MIRKLEDKLKTAQDTAQWLRSIDDYQNDEDAVCLLRVIDALIQDINRVSAKKKLTEVQYYAIRANLALASVLLDQHLSDYGESLATWDYTQTPQTIVELVAVVLNDAVLQFTGALELGRRKDYEPVSDRAINAALSLL